MSQIEMPTRTGPDDSEPVTPRRRGGGGDRLFECDDEDAFERAGHRAVPTFVVQPVRAADEITGVKYDFAMRGISPEDPLPHRAAGAVRRKRWARGGAEGAEEKALLRVSASPRDNSWDAPLNGPFSSPRRRPTAKAGVHRAASTASD